MHYIPLVPLGSIENAFCIALSTLNKPVYARCKMYAQLPGVKPTDVPDWHLLREHTHTHTHTCSDLPPWTSTVNLQFQEFYMQPWTYTSEFSRMNMDFLCIMRVKFNPYPYLSPSLDMSFYMNAYAICYRMAGLWQSWASTVGVCPRLYGNFFSDFVHG